MSNASDGQEVSEPLVHRASEPLAASDRRHVQDSPRVGSIYAPAPAGAKPLRLGIMLNSSTQPGWVARLLDGITTSGAAEIVCIIQYDIRNDVQSLAARVPPGRKPSAKPFSRRAYALYSRIDTALARRRLTQPDRTGLIDVSPWFAGVTVLHKHAIERSDGCLITDSDLANIRREALDVILALGSDTWTGEILSAARFGIWFYSWGAHHRGREDVELFWAVSDAHSMTSCSLSILGEPAAPLRVIGRLEAPVHSRSLHVTRRKTYANAVSLTLRCMRQFQRCGVDGVKGKMLDTFPESSEPATLRRGAPTNLELLLFLSRLTLRWLRFRWQYRHGEWWFLALRRRPLAFPADSEESDRLKGFAPLPATPGHSYADPFLLEEKGATHLFFEDLDKNLGKGVISHSQLSVDGTLSRPTTVLQRPYHLSYPFIFRWNGQIYMVPETGHNRTIELYRCRTFPDSWILESVLLEGWRATDTTLHQSDDGRWWMFVAIDELGEGCPALFLFQATTPLGPWHPHPQNPVQTNQRHTRPAGRLFHREGKLLRPAQDGSVRYGGGLWLMEVLELAEESYRERPLIRVGPEWLDGNLCLHHLDATDRFEVIDGMRLRPADTW
jgi:hypothetical protein